MTSAQQIKEAVDRRRRRTKVLFISIAALAALFAASLLLDSGSGTGDDTTAPAVTGQPTPPESSAGPVVLPSANEVLDDKFPVGFPHTPQGAVGAMAAMLASSWTFDVSANKQAADVYAQSQARTDAREAAAPTAQRLRAALGLPQAGPAPADAYVKVSPIGARWKVIDANRVRVALMVTVTTAANERATPSNFNVAMGSDWIWDPQTRSGDWVWTLEDVSDFVPDLADPGTPKFSSLGWLEVKS